MEKQAIIDKILSLKNERDKASNLVHSLNRDIYNLQQELGKVEFGNVGDTITFKYAGDSLYSGTIKGFQVCDWKEIPICLIDTVFRGQGITTHLIDGESIIR